MNNFEGNMSSEKAFNLIALWKDLFNFKRISNIKKKYNLLFYKIIINLIWGVLDLYNFS